MAIDFGSDAALAALVLAGQTYATQRSVKTVPWSLVSLDDGTEFIGDFPAENVTENISGVWSVEGTVGLDQPIIQFIRGNADTITMDLRVFAQHQGQGLGASFDAAVDLVTGGGFADPDNVADRVNQVKSLARKDRVLGRPHVWEISIGSEFSQQVIVNSVSGIRYDSFRAKDGSIRGIRCSVTMTRYEPYDVRDLTAQAESLVTPVKEGETYEHIAKRVHGDPLVGEALRRRNPDKRNLEQGDLVHVPKLSTLRKEVLPLTPQSLFFKTGDAQRQVLLDALDVRNEPDVSHILLESQ